MLVYRCTLYRKWRDVCDCNAIIKIEFVPALKEFHIMWYRLVTCHVISEESYSFETYSDHQEFKHIKLPDNIVMKLSYIFS